MSSHVVAGIISASWVLELLRQQFFAKWSRNRSKYRSGELNIFLRQFLDTFNQAESSSATQTPRFLISQISLRTWIWWFLAKIASANRIWLCWRWWRYSGPPKWISGGLLIVLGWKETSGMTTSTHNPWFWGFLTQQNGRCGTVY